MKHCLELKWRIGDSDKFAVLPLEVDDQEERAVYGQLAAMNPTRSLIVKGLPFSYHASHPRTS